MDRNRRITPGEEERRIPFAFDSFSIQTRKKLEEFERKSMQALKQPLVFISDFELKREENLTSWKNTENSFRRVKEIMDVLLSRTISQERKLVIFGMIERGEPVERVDLLLLQEENSLNS